MFESFATAPLACNLFTHTQLHILRTQPQLSTQTMNAMKLENAVPLPLEFNEYAEATLDILEEEARMTPTKLLKYKTVVYTVLKAFAVPLRSFRFIVFYLLKSNELLLCCTELGQHVSHSLRPLPQLCNVGAVSLPVRILSLIIPTPSSTEELFTTESLLPSAR